MIISLIRRVITSRRASVSAEFLAVVPALVFMLVGIVDIGDLLYTRFRLNAAVAAGVNYSIVRAADVSGTNAGTLASSVAKLVANSSQTSGVTATVVINHGPSATAVGSGTPSVTSADAATTNALCYCPTSASDWGVTRTCGSACGGSGLAGRFVRITASKPYTALFSSYGMVRNGAITATNLVQTQ